MADHLENYTSNIANSFFGTSDSFNMNFLDVKSLPDTIDGVTDCAGNIPHIFTADIKLNANTLSTASKEYIAATIMHEVIHAYLTLYGTNGSLNQHTDMATNYLSIMAIDLKLLYPGITEEDATALSWGGLGETQLWKDLVRDHPDQANKIVDINNQYKNATGTKGTRCVN